MSNIVASPDAQTEEEFYLCGDDVGWQEMERRTDPIHTGKRLKKIDPRKYAQCLRLLGAGVEITVVAECMEVGIHTLYAIIEADMGGQQGYLDAVLPRLKKAQNLLASRLMTLIPQEKDLMKTGVVLGIVSDKIAQMSGAPQLRVDVNVRHDHSGLIEKLAAAQQLMRQAQGVVLEAESGTVAGEVGLLGECVLPDGLIPAAVPGAVPIERKEAA